jgi:hypothetical protein
VAEGAKGEELLGKRLDELADRGARVLHDRRIPGSRANIDHIVISSLGVLVLDAKRYKGQPSLKIEGGLLRRRTGTLMVGGRKSDSLIDGMRKQLGLVINALESSTAEVPVTGMVVFVEANWRLFGEGALAQEGYGADLAAGRPQRVRSPRTAPHARGRVLAGVNALTVALSGARFERETNGSEGEAIRRKPID